jgi:hypothetical protein
MFRGTRSEPFLVPGRARLGRSGPNCLETVRFRPLQSILGRVLDPGETAALQIQHFSPPRPELRMLSYSFKFGGRGVGT